MSKHIPVSRLIGFIGLLFSLFLASDSLAGVYCVVDFGGKRCRFPDLLSCQRAAGEKGSCVLNKETMVAPTGGSPFCLVESWRTECVYQDMASCSKQAVHRRAACIANPNLTGAGKAPAPMPGGWKNRPGSGSGSMGEPAEKSPEKNLPARAKPAWLDRSGSRPEAAPPGSYDPGAPDEAGYLPSPGYSPRPGFR